MQFEDPTKKYEIVFERVRNKGIHSVPMFKLIITKPFEAVGYFQWDDIRTQQGIKGIAINRFSDIAKALKSKKDVLVTVEQEALEYIFKENKNAIDGVKEEAKLKPKTWIWWTGCDTGTLIMRPQTETGFEFRKDLEKIYKTIEKSNNYRPPVEFTNEIIGEDARGNHIISNETVMKVYNKIEGCKKEIKAVEQAERDKIFSTAKETGVEQVLERYPVECNDPDESCDVDIITIYAMPDGTTKETRNHTW